VAFSYLVICDEIAFEREQLILLQSLVKGPMSAPEIGLDETCSYPL